MREAVGDVWFSRPLVSKREILASSAGLDSMFTPCLCDERL